MTNQNLSIASLKLAKIAFGGVVLLGLGAVSMVYAKPAQNLPTVEKLELDRYLGKWYEVARKPLSFQKKCDRDVAAMYTLNENGNIKVDNRCYTKEGEQTGSVGEAYVQNAPYNTKLKVSFLPEAIRWLPVGRGDYWVLKIDDKYQTVLVGEPKLKYMWVLSRTPNPDQKIVGEYLDYAKSVGYDLGDVIHTKQTQK